MVAHRDADSWRLTVMTHATVFRCIDVLCTAVIGCEIHWALNTSKVQLIALPHHLGEYDKT